MGSEVVPEMKTSLRCKGFGIKVSLSGFVRLLEDAIAGQHGVGTGAHQVAPNFMQLSRARPSRGLRAPRFCPESTSSANCTTQAVRVPWLHLSPPVPAPLCLPPLFHTELEMPFALHFCLLNQPLRALGLAPGLLQTVCLQTLLLPSA